MEPVVQGVVESPYRGEGGSFHSLPCLGYVLPNDRGEPDLRGQLLCKLAEVQAPCREASLKRQWEVGQTHSPATLPGR